MRDSWFKRGAERRNRRLRAGSPAANARFRPQGHVPGFRCIAAIVAIILCAAVNAQSRELGEILRLVEKNTPALKAAHARTAMQQADVRKAKSGYWGEVDALARNSNFNDGRLINPITYPVHLEPKLFDDHQIGYGISGHVPLDINGRITAQVRAADKELEAALDREQDVRLQLLHSTADLYHSLQGIRATERALEKQIEALQSHIRVATVAIRAGRTAPVERLRLVADQEAVKGKLATLRGQEQTVRARLAALLQEPSFADPVPALSVPPAEKPPGTPDIEHRPDIRALLASREAADAGVRAAVATRLPDLGLNGSWMQNQGFNGEGDDTWTLSVQLMVPLWDGGGRRATVARAESARTVIRHQLATLRNQARAEITSARATLHAAEITYRATVAAVAAARENARIQSDRFAEGRLSAADLVDAEASLASARSDSALALTSWWQAMDHLRRAAGLEPLAYHGTRETARAATGKMALLAPGSRKK